MAATAKKRHLRNVPGRRKTGELRQIFESMRLIVESRLFAKIRPGVALFHIIASHRNKRGKLVPISEDAIQRALIKGHPMAPDLEIERIRRWLKYHSKHNRFREAAPGFWTIKGVR